MLKVLKIRLKIRIKKSQDEERILFNPNLRLKLRWYPSHQTINQTSCHTESVPVRPRAPDMVMRSQLCLKETDHDVHVGTEKAIAMQFSKIRN